MSENLKLKNEFQNFIFSDDQMLYSPDEIKLINLIIKHFDKIAEVGTAGGNKRAKLFKDLLINEWAKIPTDLVITRKNTNKEIASFPVKQIKKIDIENFRGFSNLFSHDFTKPYTLIYGTNGSGKTSFCEALEYSLLGYISEAESKRYDSNKYIVNLVTGKGQKPKLTVIDNNDSELIVSASPNSYHFCFIEKNRIDGFARISANTPSNQTQLLSTLLGLEDFNQYLSGFTENIENYINISESDGIRYKEFAQKTRESDADRASIETNNKNLLNLQSNKELLVRESKLEMSFEEMDSYLHSSSDKKGRLSEIDKEIQSISPIRYESSSMKNITDNCERILQLLKEYKDLRGQLDKSKDQISFKQLFLAVQELKGTSGDNCPACLTPIDRVIKNPFDHATERLSELSKLVQMEEKLESYSEEITSKMTILLRDISIKVKFARELRSSPQLNFSEHLLSQELIHRKFNDKIIKIEELINEVDRNHEQLEILEQLLNFKNLEYENSTQKKNNLQVEKDHLQGLSGKLKNIQTQRIYLRK